MLLHNIIFWPTLILAVNGLPNDFRHRIAGGEKSKIESHPYMVAIYQGSYNNACSASIITTSLILTASHCIPEDITRLIIRTGSEYQRINGTLHRAVEYSRHENYGLDLSNNGKVSFNDIAIVKIQPDFEFDVTRQPISLYDSDEVVKPGITGVVSGWGFVPSVQKIPWTWEDRVYNGLQSVNVPVYDKIACAEEHMNSRNYTLKPGQMCAGKAKGSCRGDSGAPLVVNGRQAALVSWGYGCGIDGYPPTVYTEISYFRKWIDRQVEKLTGEKLVKASQAVATSVNKIEFHDGQSFYQGNPIWS